MGNAESNRLGRETDRARVEHSKDAVALAFVCKPWHVHCSALRPEAMPSRTVVVGVFEREPQAREAVEAVRSLGLTDSDLGLLAPAQTLNTSDARSAGISEMLSSAAANSDRADLESVLVTLGVPGGDARFYAEQAAEGRSLVMANAYGGRVDEIRNLLRDHGGFDVESRGADFIRGDGAGVRGGVGPRPIDVTTNWTDFRSRYQMLWQQHYGTTDATWEQMEPLYRYAWQLANDAGYRGRAWSDVEASLQRDWQASAMSRSMRWQEARGPMRDVWEDVAQEALSGAEGGADRRIATSGTDQTIAARDVLPPRQGAA